MTSLLDDAALRVACDGLSIADAVAEIHAFADTWSVDAGRQLAGEGQQVACPGCRLGHCCEQPVLVSFAEALVIARRLVREGRATRAFRRELRRAGEKHERSLLRGTESDARNRCPFIDQRNLCTIYSDRPMNCRTYLVFDGRENCRPYRDRTDGARPFVAAVNNQGPVSVAIHVSLTTAEGLGWPFAIYMRALPLQVATWLEAAAGPPEEMWERVRAASTMEPSDLRRIAHNQQGSAFTASLRDAPLLARAVAEGVEVP